MSIRRPKIKLDNLELFDKITEGDTHYAKTALLLQFYGTNGTSNIIDSSKYIHSITPAGTAQISTSQSKFGGSSLLLDGNSDYLDIPHHDLFEFGSGNFTMEFWFRVDSGTGTLAYNTILDKADGGPSGIGPWWIQIRNNGGVFSVGTHISSAGGSWTSWDIINNAYLATISANTWYHYALVRNGSTFTIYLNGTSIATATNSNALWESTSTVSIGARQQNTKSYYFGGNIDELRITKGIARYTSNFEVPDKELTDSPGDVNKKVVVDDEAKGLDIGEGGVDESRMAEAWVTFDGNNTTTSSPEIFDSYNVSAITDNGMGDYTIHYSQELNSANSCAIATIKTPSYEIVGNPENHPYSDDARADVWEQTSTYVKVRTTYGTTFGQGEFDSDRISVVVFAN